MRTSLTFTAVILAASLVACAGKNTEDVSDPVPQQGGYTTVLNARVMAGQGSGVVGLPLEEVEISVHLGDQTLGPVMTDASGSFRVDALSLFPPETVDEPEVLRSAEPVNAEVHFSKEGYRPTVEIVTFPVDAYREFTFYLKGEGY